MEETKEQILELIKQYIEEQQERGNDSDTFEITSDGDEDPTFSVTIDIDNLGTSDIYKKYFRGS